MGRPALLGSHPRGPQYRGVQVPPHYGNRPRWRKKRTHTRHMTITPKVLSQHLAVLRLHDKITDSQPDTTWKQYSQQTKQRCAMKQTPSLTHKLARTLPGGNHAEVAGLLPPWTQRHLQGVSTPKSHIAIAAIFLHECQIARKFDRKSAIFARKSQNRITIAGDGPNF